MPLTSTLALKTAAVITGISAVITTGLYIDGQWKQWNTNEESTIYQSASAQKLGEEWRSQVSLSLGDDAASSDSDTISTDGIPTISEIPEFKEEFARLFIPAFGDDYVRTIAEGIDTQEVLNKIGVGHYPGTALPGEIGNFAIAAHRMTYGAAFENLDLLEQGDEIIVETKDGWYTYVVERSKIVAPDEVDVIAPTPENPEVVPSERWMTLTTCTPKWTSAKRLIVFAKFESFQSR